MERLASTSGPTGGKIVLRDGREPSSVVILHCVGARDENHHEYCSRICCMYAMKLAHLIKERVPKAAVYELYVDIRAYGKGFEEFYRRVQEEGVIFIRGKGAEVNNSENGKLIVTFEDTLFGKVGSVEADMVVLAVALEPRRDAKEVARIFSISLDKDGFFLERYPKLAPVSTVNRGIFVAGACQGPKDIPRLSGSRGGCGGFVPPR